MKYFFYALSLLVLILITFILSFGLFFWQRKEDLLSNYLTAKTGVDVTLDKITFKDNTFRIDNFRMANADGYQLPYALTAETIAIKAPLSHYFKKKIILEQVWLDQIEMGIEFKNREKTEGNWSDILSHLDSNATSTLPLGPEPSLKSYRESRSVFIDQLLFTKIRVSLILYGEKKAKVFDPIDRIQLTQINSSEGLPTEELSELIIKKLMEQISLLQGFGNMLLTAPKAAARGVMKPFTILFGKKKGSSGATAVPPPPPAQEVGS